MINKDWQTVSHLTAIMAEYMRRSITSQANQGTKGLEFDVKAVRVKCGPTEAMITKYTVEVDVEVRTLEYEILRAEMPPL